MVQVKIIHASDWDVKASKLLQLFKLAKAAMTGKPPATLGGHAEMRLG